jgi:hypothetical protein
MAMRLHIQDVLVYEGDAIPIPRVGDVIYREDELVPIESVTWDFRDSEAVIVGLVVGNRPYTY